MSAVDLPVRGLWMGASRVLGRPVRADEPYPHICQWPLPGQHGRHPIRLTRRDCAACAEQAARDRETGRG